MPIEKLLAEATPRPWLVDRDERPDMEWNNHIAMRNGNAVCFMANSGKVNNVPHMQAAELIVSLANSAADLVALKKAIDALKATDVLVAEKQKSRRDEFGQEILDFPGLMKATAEKAAAYETLLNANAALEQRPEWREG